MRLFFHVTIVSVIAMVCRKAQLKVYIAGPVHGMENHQHYRQKLKQVLASKGFNPVDPLERQRPNPSSVTGRNFSPKEIINSDLNCLKQCDLLVAFLPTISAGTCMELFYGKLMNKETVVITPMDDLSPWIIGHADHIFRTFEDFEKWLNSKSN